VEFFAADRQRETNSAKDSNTGDINQIHLSSPKRTRQTREAADPAAGKVHAEN
jgi:hypothetical protein